MLCVCVGWGVLGELYGHLNSFHVIAKLDSFFPRQTVKEEEFESMAIPMNVPYD